MRYLSAIPLTVLAAPALAQEAAPAAQSAPATATAATDAAAAPEPAAAPDTSEADSTDPEDKREIVVTAGIVRGQVDTVEAPVTTLDENDIQATGATSVADLLSRISPQTNSGRGRGGGGGQPVVLVNGQRIGNFRELRNFPPEAIQRVEVLPESVALKYGFPPDSRVVNLILKKKFRSKSLEGTYGLPTRGGFNTWGLEATLTKIDGAARLSATATTDDTSPLFEGERGVIQPAAPAATVSGDPVAAQYRTLISDSRNFGLNLAWTRGIGKDGLGGSFSLSGAASRADSHSYQGLDSVVLVDPAGNRAYRTLPNPLERVTHTTTLQAGAGYNTYLGTWQLSTTVDGSHTETASQFDRRADLSALVAAAAAGTLPIAGPLPAVPDAGFEQTKSTVNSVTSLATLIGRPLRLPGGEVGATLKAGYAWSGIDSSDSRMLLGPTSLNRGDLSFGGNVTIPITSRRENFGQAIGNLSLNVSAGYDYLSDFGSLTDWSAGLTWQPTEKLTLGSSYIVNQAAPSLTQLGNPLTQTFNVPIYDFSRGQTALVTLIGGGNPNLLKEEQRDIKLSANWQLPLPSANLIVEYFRNRSTNVTSSFPLLTPDIEAAFPGRVVRDTSGRLISIDQRPVTFARQESSRLRAGFNFAGGFGKPDPNAAGGMGAMFGGGGRQGGGGPRGGGGRGARGGGGGGMFGGPPGAGRFSIGVFDTIQFQNTVLVAPGGPVLDLLNGDALTGGGTPRNTVEFNGGVFYKGIGGFFQGTWTSPTTIRASGLPGTSDLRFGSLASVNLFLFIDFNQKAKLIKDVPVLKNTRLQLRIENLFDARQKVTDANGLVPLSYQPDYLDPRGRVITLQLRKSF